MADQLNVIQYSDGVIKVQIQIDEDGTIFWCDDKRIVKVKRFWEDHQMNMKDLERWTQDIIAAYEHTDDLEEFLMDDNKNGE